MNSDEFVLTRKCHIYCLAFTSANLLYANQRMVGWQEKKMSQESNPGCELYLRPLGWLVPQLLLEFPLVLHEAYGMPFGHLLHVHLSHAVIFLEILVPRSIEVLELQVMRDLACGQRGLRSSVMLKHVFAWIQLTIMS